MNFRKFFLTVGYSGLFPKAPGTIGSFVSLIIGVVLLQYIHNSTLFLLSLLITVLAVKQIDIYEQELGIHDSKEIVIDELAGMWIALSICNIDETNLYVMSALAFIFFRLFDIFKPSIIGRIDKNIDGGWGVMGDDVIAGIAGGICANASYTLIIKFLI